MTIMTIDHEALDQLIVLLENDIDALGWDQPAKLYLIAGTPTDPRFEMAGEIQVGHPYIALQAMWMSGMRIPDSTLGVAIVNECWRAKTVTEVGSARLLELCPPLRSTLDIADLMGLTPEGREELIAEAWQIITLNVRPSHLPDELRVESRQVLVMAKDAAMRNGTRERDGQFQFGRDEGAGTAEAWYGDMPQALLNLTRNVAPFTRNERSIPDTLPTV